MTRPPRLAMGAFFAILTIAAVVCMTKGGMNALASSKDFQWSPTTIFISGSDPYEAFLSGDSRILLTQAPNYLPHLYVLMVPLGLMTFEVAKFVWATFNILLAISAPLMLAHKAHFGRTPTLLLLLAFLVANPTRTVISNGQLSLAILVGALVAYTARRPLNAGVALTLALTKHSFAPPLVLGLLRRSSLATLIWALGLTLALTSCFIGVVRENPWQVFSNNLSVNGTSVALGAGDAMSIAESISGSDISGNVSIIVGLLTCVVLTSLCWKLLTGDWLLVLATVSLISLMSFKHLSYDFVFLLPVVAYAYAHMQSWRRVTTLAICAYVWYFYQFASAGLRRLDAVGGVINPLIVFMLSASVLALIITSEKSPQVDSDAVRRTQIGK